eukprot:scaffold37813_cov72-Attheya_sp.AAC.1
MSTARGDLARQDSEIEQSAIEKIAEYNDNEQNLVTLADAHDERSIIVTLNCATSYLDSGCLHMNIEVLTEFLNHLTPTKQSYYPMPQASCSAMSLG